MVETRPLLASTDAHNLAHEPPDVYLDDNIMDILFSPTANVLASAQVTGEVRFFSYNEQETKEVMTFDYHKESCRKIEFNPTGSILYTASADMSIGVISNGKLEGRIEAAHKAPINALLHIENDFVLATGDDDGIIKIWDLRMSTQGKNPCVMTFEEHEETVTGLVMGKNQLLVSSAGDGFLGVFDLRKNELYAMSDNFEED